MTAHNIYNILCILPPAETGFRIGCQFLFHFLEQEKFGFLFRFQFASHIARRTRRNIDFGKQLNQMKFFRQPNISQWQKFISEMPTSTINQINKNKWREISSINH